MSDHAPLHVFPDGKGHLTDFAPCWCGPQIVQPCPECSQPHAASGIYRPCWKCGGNGNVPPFTEDMARIVIHNDIAKPSSRDGEAVLL